MHASNFSKRDICSIKGFGIKKILFIDTGIEYGGGTKSLLYLIEALKKAGIYDVFVYFENNYMVKDKKILDIMEEKEIKIIKFNKPKFEISKFKREIFRIFYKKLIKKKRYEYDLRFAKKMLLENNKFDFIHLNNHFSANLSYISAANDLGIKVIQHLRKNSPLDKFDTNILNKNIFKAISVSKSTFEFYNKYLKFDNCVIYNPVFKKQNYKKIDKFEEISIIMPANFLKLKGHDLVFDAMLNLNRDDLRLYIAGSGSFEKKTKDKLDILIKNGLVVNLGFVENMDEIYPKFDYILGFSENEGLPRVVIEALSYGLGVIFSNINVINEIYNISSKKDDFYIVNRTANDLHNLLLKIEKPKNKEIDFNIINTFSFENFSKSILNFYSNYR